ncbi:response regulator receiver domain [Vreelandella sulfidaeris]|uniref:response regulator receiver domain n=1 Tax=Vreelandella sulfidaeris TaxID=115553 RepID=UPI0035EE5291
MTETNTTFEALCNSAVKAFLQTVVVIDNEASLVSDYPAKRNVPTTAARKRLAAPGKAATDASTSSDKSTNVTGSQTSTEDDEIAAHRLELNKVSLAFAEQGLTCGVYLPTENDPAEPEELIAATVRAILPTDSCVLDWQLRKDDSGPAIKAIKQILKKDMQEGGRLRLILIYTAETLEDASPALNRALQSDGHDIKFNALPNGPVIIGDHFRIVFINKPTLGRRPSDDPAVVSWENLPKRIIHEFTILSRGLLRAFALESVAAVRRDIHRILAQFDQELDPVYAGDRATKPDPDDAGRLVVELLQSELSLSIGASGAEVKTLGSESCIAWLADNDHRLFDVDLKMRWQDERPDDRKINTDVRKRLINQGPKDLKTEKFHAKVTRAFFAETQEELWERYSSHYAVLTTLAYHSGKQAGRTIGGTPTLSFGTVIGNDESDWLCIQPACDSVRIHGEASFLFIKLIQNDADFDLILPKNDQFMRFQVANEGKSKHLRELRTLWFSPLEGKDVILAQQPDSDGYFFIDIDDERWRWRAQLREMTAVHLAQKAVRAIGRIGLNEFEWLRTSAK